ncbi:MAG TPA: cohesin domain-containing protein [Methylomirabilota bacterium]|nr:cohesin domain-containing protein [Methylomirabilota bacterium]
MPRKTLALISGLVLVTIILFIIALSTGKQTPPPSQQAMQPSPTSPAHTVLTLSPNPVSVQPGQQGSVDVMIDSSDNAVNAVQLELSYDPTVMTVKLTPGPLFTNAVVLINRNNIQTGRVTYALGIQPNQPTINGKGSVATITFTAKYGVAKQSPLTLLPTSLVTARGVATSVLKMGNSTMVNVGMQAATSPTTQNSQITHAPPLPSTHTTPAY